MSMWHFTRDCLVSSLQDSHLKNYGYDQQFTYTYYRSREAMLQVSFFVSPCPWLSPKILVYIYQETIAATAKARHFAVEPDHLNRWHYTRLRGRWLESGLMARNLVFRSSIIKSRLRITKPELHDLDALCNAVDRFTRDKDI